MEVTLITKRRNARNISPDDAVSGRRMSNKSHHTRDLSHLSIHSTGQMQFGDECGPVAYLRMLAPNP